MASTYVLAVVWSGLVIVSSIILLLGTVLTVRYCAIFSEVPAVFWAASITTLLLKTISKSLTSPPSVALTVASLASPGVTIILAVDVYIGVVVVLSNIYPPITPRIVTIIRINAHLENFFMYFALLY